MTQNTARVSSKSPAKSNKTKKQGIKSNIGKAIAIKWLDHYTTSGWHKSTNPDPVVIDSLGFIVSETPKMYVLAQNAVFGEDNDPGGNHIGIIKACITKKKFL